MKLQSEANSLIGATLFWSLSVTLELLLLLLLLLAFLCSDTTGELDGTISVTRRHCQCHIITIKIYSQIINKIRALSLSTIYNSLSVLTAIFQVNLG